MNLAARMRPTTLDEYVDQQELVGEGKLIRRMIQTGSLSSIILWGPPGSGKTTLASIIAKESDSNFHMLSAVSTGKEDLHKIIKEAREQTLFQKKTIIFIDEIHRWNKAQQDVLLPYVETGLVTLIGATTENPSFEVNSALLSRSKVFVLKGLSSDGLSKIITRALTDKEKGLGDHKKKITKDAQDLLIRLSGGDARILLNALEMAATNFESLSITPEIIQEVFQTKTAGLYDKKADEHYNIISAFIKSMRGSDPDAALYYLARMLENGEDPKFIARRMIIFSSEDIGIADKGALIQANAGFEAVTKIGMPEAQLILAHICVYLATAPKSRACNDALALAKEAVYEYPNEPIPLHLRNAPTKLMKELDYGKGYEMHPPKGTSYLPEKLKGKKFLRE
jgi:putative ATPase